MSLRIALARVRHRIGWAGVAGLVMLAFALQLAVRTRLAPSVTLPALPVARAASPSPVADTASGMTLPSREGVPAVLAAIEQGAVAAGLGWPAADYRVVPATESEPARLEVRCQLKGAYPKVRGLVSRLMADVHGLTLREFSVTRPNAETADVEAKLTLAVFLQDAVIADPKVRP